MLKRVILFMAVLIGGLPSSIRSQQTASSSASDRGLPHAPDRGALPDAPGYNSQFQESGATISGTIMDTSGSVIQGARVTLAGTVDRIVKSGSNGEFTFSGLPPGSFRLKVTGAGMGDFVSPEIPLHAGDMRLVPPVVLPIAAAATEVRVYANPSYLAEEQVRIAVEQRVLGILPNFYSSFDWNAPPLGSRQKFELAFRAETDPVSFLGAGVLAGVEQGNNSFPGYGQGAAGFAKRYGAAYADDFIGRTMGSAVLPSLLHQDPRYFYKGSGNIRSRALYAIGAAFICRGDNGHWQPNYSHILGSFSVGGMSNLYYPSGSRGVSLTIFNGLIETAGNAGNNLLREFVLRGLTTKASDYKDSRR